MNNSRYASMVPILRWHTPCPQGKCRWRPSAIGFTHRTNVRPLLCLLLALFLIAGTGCGLKRNDSNAGGPLPSVRSDATGDEAKISDLQSIRFEDRRPGSGIDFPLSYSSQQGGHANQTSQKIGIRQTIGFGAALLDVDGDGLLDLLLVGPDRVTLYRNLGNFHFVRMQEVGLRQKGYWQGVAVGDFDQDGRPDLFISGYHASALYHNISKGQGDLRFEEVTTGSGLENTSLWESSAGCADLDGDGRLDLYVTCYVDLRNKSGVCTYPGGIATSCSPTAFPPQRGHLYRNITPPGGKLKFEDVTQSWGLDTAHGNGLGVAFGYLDPIDGREAIGRPNLALYLANDQRPCDLFVNHLQNHSQQSERRFDNQGTISGTALRIDGAPQSGMGVDFGDYDNDGREDILVTNYQNEPKSLYHNDGQGIFTNTSLDTGLGAATLKSVGWGVKWVDLDNDGWLDVAIANGHPLHRIHELDPETEARQPIKVVQNRGGKFREVTNLGTDIARPISGRALCVGDIDNDGRMDLLVSDIEGQPLLLRNITPTNGNHWLTVRLSGRTISEGAWVTVHAGERHWTRRSTSGGSYLSASDPRVHFGLGATSHIDFVEVHWPDGRVKRMDAVSLDRELSVE